MISIGDGGCPPHGHFRRGDRFLGKAHTPGPLRPAFPAFLAGAGRPLLPPMIDYSVFSQLAAARGSIISGPIQPLGNCFQFLHLGQIRLTRHLVIGRQVRRWWPTGGRVASYGTRAAFE